MTRVASGLFGTVLIAALLAPAPADAKRRSTEEWTHEKGAVGNAVYSRRVEDSRIREYKVEIGLASSPDAVWTLLTDWGAPPFMVRVLEQRVLSGGGSDVILYQKDDCSPLHPRDYAVRIRTSQEGTTYTMTSELANDQAPPVEDGVVRLADYYREWTLTPDGSGSILTMVVFYDPGGRIPDKLYNTGVPSELLLIKESIETALAAR